MNKPLKKYGYRRYAGLLLFTVLVVAAMLFSGCEREATVQAAGSRPTLGGRAPGFQVSTFDGGTFNLRAASGSPVVISFWASWCGPCRVEAAAIQEAYEKFGPSGVRFIGVAVQDSLQGSRTFIDKFGWTFPAGPDVDESIMRAYKVFGIPKTFVVTKDGEINYVHSGAIRPEVLAREIMKVL